MSKDENQKVTYQDIMARTTPTWQYDDEIEPVPRVSQVGVVVQDEPLGNHLDHHLHWVDGQEDNSASVKFDFVQSGTKCKTFLQISQM